MGKLYPPIIEGTIPAFTGTTLVVPFSLNKANSTSDIIGFSLKIKTVQNNITLATLEQKDTAYFDLIENYQVTFLIDKELQKKITVGQFYKIQLAFLSNKQTVGEATTELGYYSTVGVIKYTTVPSVTIAGLKPPNTKDSMSSINRHLYRYLGIYSQENGDTTEKIYSSRFVLKDSDDNIIVDSGDIIHDTSQDTSPNKAEENFMIAQELTPNKSYYLQYIVTTINNLITSSALYRIMQQNVIKPDLKADLIATSNFEDGYIDLKLVGHLNPKGEEYYTTGNYILSRAASNNNWTWENLLFFTFQAQKPTRFLYRDFTIEQGVEYQYAVQQYNDNALYSDRIKSNIIKADFEDSFLYDGTRQLKIRFNPKVSSFKNNIPEQKVDTIGSKYPFIFRNGRVHYKEFPISGLISYQSDENKLFYPVKPREDLASHPYDITSEDIYNEREFKLQVLEWLNNGELKIFKSPTEGNYFVKLLNVSLTPIDSVGRMLHTFNCTAYEMYNYDYNNLLDFNFINVYVEQEEQLRMLTVELTGKDEKLAELIESLPIYANAGVTVNFNEQQHAKICNHTYSLDSSFNYTNLFVQNGNVYSITAPVLKGATNGVSHLDALLDINKNTILYLTGRINVYPVYMVSMEDMKPGTKINFVLDPQGTTESIQINATGKYNAVFDEPIIGIDIPVAENINKDLLSNGYQGSITYGYYSKATDMFNTVSDVAILDTPCQQFIGKPYKLYYSIEDGQNVSTNNLIQVIENVKRNISNIFFLKFYSRPIMNIYFQDNRRKNFTIANLKSQTFYWDKECTQPIIDYDKLYPNYIYSICRARYDYSYQQDVMFEDYYLDANISRGYYVDTLNNRIDAFIGYYLDGSSTNEKTIIFKHDTDVKKVTINKDTIDLRHVEQYSLPQEMLNNISLVTFGDGIICEIGYQYTDITYSMENTNDLIKSKRADYETYYSYWTDLHGVDKKTIPFQSLTALTDEATLLITFVNQEITSDILRETIKKAYDIYIDYLALSLKQYKEAHETL